LPTQVNTNAEERKKKEKEREKGIVVAGLVNFSNFSAEHILQTI
jgi:hypothetical protein